MQKFIVAFILLALPAAVFSQQGRYWVKFKDKNNNTFSLNNPQQFLSQQSIDRRLNQGISLDETDLPLTGLYVDSVSGYGAKIIHRLKWFNLVVVEVDSAAADNVPAIASLACVDSMALIEFIPARYTFKKSKMEVAQPVDQRIVYPNKYGIGYRQIQMLNGDLLHQMGYKGQGVTISVMDNGFNNTDNVRGFDSVRSRILFTWDFVHNQPDVYHDGGHGTNTFSCIGANKPGQLVGTAPDASFVLMQTEENGAEWVMEEYNWAAAAEMADSAGVQVFSTSLGYDEFEDGTGSHTYADLTGDKTVITHAGNVAAGKGIIVVNSAGNEGANSWRYISVPADGDSIIAVGAVDSAENLGGFSSRGPNFSGRIKPDLCAQGVKAGAFDIEGSTVYIGGTSFSCPVLAGCIASLWSAFPDKTAREIKEAVMLSADRFWKPDNDYGYGIPDFYTAYLLLKTNYNGNLLRVSDDVLIFPNPFTADLNIAIYSSERKNHLVEIFDLAGRKVFSTHIFVREKSYEIVRLDGVGSIASGQYILRLDGQKQFSHPILKVGPNY